MAERTRKEGVDIAHYKKKNLCSRLVAILIAVFIIVVGGFLYTVQVEVVIPFTVPQHRILVETSSIPYEELQKVNCRLANYDFVSEEVLDDFSRRITLRNKADDEWGFIISSEFTFANATSSSAPATMVDVVTKDVVIGALQQPSFVVGSTVNISLYNNIYVKTTIVPDEKDCVTRYGFSFQNQTKTTTKTEEKTYMVPYVERVSFWRHLFS